MSRVLPAWHAAPDVATQVIEPGGPSPHLTWEQLGWVDYLRVQYTPYPPMWRASRLVPLVAAWERTVELLGTVPGVRRGYWVPERVTNKLRASAEMHHVNGYALDVTPPPGWTVVQLVDRLCTLVLGTAAFGRRNGPVGWMAVLNRCDHVHVDVAPRAQIALYRRPRGMVRAPHRRGVRYTGGLTRNVPS